MAILEFCYYLHNKRWWCQPILVRILIFTDPIMQKSLFIIFRSLMRRRKDPPFSVGKQKWMLTRRFIHAQLTQHVFHVVGKKEYTKHQFSSENTTKWFRCAPKKNLERKKSTLTCKKRVNNTALTSVNVCLVFFLFNKPQEKRKTYCGRIRGLRPFLHFSLGISFKTILVS